MKWPLVSIVIPTYNHADYLYKSISSVLSQDYPNIELIVIDDGSTDDSKSIAKAFGEKIRFIQQENMGQSRTLTKGWSLASGNILAYISADDVLYPTAVSEAVAFLESNPTIVATYCDFDLLDPDNHQIRKVETQDFSYKTMLCEVSCPIGPGAFFRKEVYLQSGPWNSAYRQMPDFDFWLRIGLYGQIARIPKRLAGFRVHENSQTFSHTSVERASEPVSIIASIFNDPAANWVPDNWRRKALANAHLISAQLHLRSLRYQFALASIRRAAGFSIAETLKFRCLRMLVNAAINRPGHRIFWTFRRLGRKLVR